MTNFMHERSHAVEQEDVMAFLDGELPVQDAARVAEHMEKCAQCRELAESFRGLSRKLTVWEVNAADTQMSAPILAMLEAIGNTQPTDRKTSPLWRTILGRPLFPKFAVGTVCAALVLLLVLQHGVKEAAPRQVARNVAPTFSRPQAASSTNFSVKVAPSRNSSSQGGVIGGVVPDDVPPPAQEAMVPAEKVQSSSDSDSFDVTVPMIAREAQLELIANAFDTVRGQMEAIIKAHGGYLANLNVTATAGAQRTISASMRVPADQLDATLTEMKRLGRLQSESQSGEEVTAEYVDLQARLTNARNTEKRLTELLQTRTGKLSDVLAAEQEISRVRGDIESMEGELKILARRVSYAKLDVSVSEDYKAPAVVTPSLSWQSLRNTAAASYLDLENSVVGALLFMIYWVPNIVVWGAILGLGAWIVWRIVRRYRGAKDGSQ
jgi:anti-sigma factor RsiW